MSSVISLSHLSKNFSVFDKKPGLGASIRSIFYRPQRTVKAVDDVSFEIGEGELVGFIGPNGAGKTTTLKCLSGLLYPSSGDVRVLGFEPQHRQREYLRQIGFVMGQKNQLWWDIPPQETFLLNKAIYDISDHDYQRRLNFFIDTLDIGQVIQVQTKKLSLGQRMKCEFVAALLHNPRVLFLDEPTIGLDVVASLKIRDFIRSVNREFHTTIILTSHNMADVQELCQRVIVIDKGQLQYDGALRELSEKYSQDKILKFTFSEEVTKKSLEKYGKITSFSSSSATFALNKKKFLGVASDILKKFPVSDLNIEETSVEEVIRQIFTHA